MLDCTNEVHKRAIQDNGGPVICPDCGTYLSATLGKFTPEDWDTTLHASVDSLITITYDRDIDAKPEHRVQLMMKLIDELRTIRRKQKNAGESNRAREAVSVGELQRKVAELRVQNANLKMEIQRLRDELETEKSRPAFPGCDWDKY